MRLEDLFLACNNVAYWEEVTIHDGDYTRTATEWRDRMILRDREVSYFRVTGSQMEVWLA